MNSQLENRPLEVAARRFEANFRCHLRFAALLGSSPAWDPVARRSIRRSGAYSTNSERPEGVEVGFERGDRGSGTAIRLVGGPKNDRFWQEKGGSFALFRRLFVRDNAPIKPSEADSARILRPIGLHRGDPGAMRHTFAFVDTRMGAHRPSPRRKRPKPPHARELVTWKFGRYIQP
jgi:hypothetical protein